jgi:hypothetical protein
MENKVLTQEEIQQLKNLQFKQNSLVTNLGNLEYNLEVLNTQRLLLKQEIQNQISEELKLGEELQKKYGDGNIDLEKGEFIPIP